MMQDLAAVSFMESEDGAGRMDKESRETPFGFPLSAFRFYFEHPTSNFESPNYLIA
jgi:hypothetical protein